MRKMNIAVSILMLIILTSCNAYSAGKNKERMITGKTKSIFYSSTIASPEYPGMNIELIRFNSSEYHYSVRYPKINEEKWVQEMNRLSSKAIEDFIMKAENTDFSAQKEPLELQIDFQIYSFSEQFLSVKIEQSVSRAGEEQQKTITVFNFDRDSGEFLKLSDLFKDGSNYYEKLKNLAFLKLKNHPKIKAELSPEEFAENFEFYKETIKHFLIKNDSLIILFDAADLGVHSSNDLEITFSKHELRDILKKKTVLGIVEEVKNPPKKPENNAGGTVPGPNIKYVALTFDDGPHKTVTPKILDILKKYDARATFFVLGIRAQQNPEVLKRIADEGHEIGNHTWAHPSLSKISQSQIKEELRKTDEFVKKITGKVPALLRPPYGDLNRAVKAIVDKPIITWSLDTRDWENRDPDAILEKVKTQVKDGAIILMHDIHATTAEGLEPVLQWLFEQGYQFVTVSELLGFSTNPELAQSGEVYNSRAS